jgi:hypothetical protein
VAVPASAQDVATAKAEPPRAATADQPKPLSDDSVRALRDAWRIVRPTGFQVATAVSGVSPALTASTPSGFGAQWGDAFLGLGFQARTRFTRERDGAVVTGAGVGDRMRWVALELALTSFGTIDTGFGTNSTVSLKAHRVLMPGTSVALGLENALRLGPTANNGPDGGRSWYVAASRILLLPSRGDRPPRELLLNAGVGTGRFRRESLVQRGSAGFGAFASVGLRLNERSALIADLTGQDLYLAGSVVPFRCVPAVVTAGLADITRSAGDGARLVISVGLGLSRESLTRAFNRRCLA